MRGIIISNGFSFSRSTETKAKRLQEVFERRGVELQRSDGLHQLLRYQSGEILLPFLAGFDFCIYLDKDRYLATAINDQLPTFNSARAIELCDDKMLTYMALRSRGIRTPLTIPSPLNYSDWLDREKMAVFLDQIEASLTYPLVVKQVYGSLGKQVHLVSSRRELEAIYELLYPYPHLYQEYIKTEYGTDYRLITIGGKLVAAMRRQNLSDFRSNIALGGVGTPFEAPESFKMMAEQVSLLLGLDYAGVDLLLGEDGYPVLDEVNSNAFFAEVERVSDIDVTALLADHILQKLQKQ